LWDETSDLSRTTSASLPIARTAQKPPMAERKIQTLNCLYPIWQRSRTVQTRGGFQMATVAERIQKELLRSRSPLDDDQLAERVGVRRQAINQECRYLESKGVLRRFHPSHSKILNEILD
jgi:hypothetical protein